MKFAHIADTHIRNLKYHYEYRKVFERMYEILREEQIDCIVHCGDLAHTKTQLSPEYFDMAQWFLKNLADRFGRDSFRWRLHVECFIYL